MQCRTSKLKESVEIQWLGSVYIVATSETLASRAFL